MSTTMKRNLILAGIISASCVVFPSASHAFSLTLPPSGFTSGGGNVSAVNPTGSTLDSTATPNGFGSFFATNGNLPFLALGATGTQTISGSQKSANSVADSTFTLNAADLLTNLTVSFQYAYRGTGVGDPNRNSFNITVFDPTFTSFLTVFDSGIGSAGFGSGTQTGTITSSFLTAGGAGTYTFEITLAESNTAQNVAAGFNQITVNTEVPFDFDPSAGLLFLGLGLGLNKFRKDFKAKKNEPKV